MKRQNYLITILFISVFSFAIRAQSWSPVGNGIGSGNSVRLEVESDNSSIYVVEIDMGGGSTVSLRIWDGQAWAMAPAYTSPISYELGDIAIYNGEVYVGLVAGQPGGALIKYDGSNWVTVVIPNTVEIYSVRALEVINGELYIGGNFEVTIGGTSYKNIVKFDGVNIKGIGGINSRNNEVTDFHSLNGNIYCALPNNVAEVSSSGLNILSNFSFRDERRFLTSYNNELYCIEENLFYKISGGSKVLVHTLPFQISDADEMGGGLYLVGDTLIAGSVSGGGLEKYDGISFTALTSPNFLHAGAVYNGELYYFSCFQTQYNGQQYNRAFKMSNPIGVKETQPRMDNLLIYPNPSSGMVNFTNTKSEFLNVKIMNAEGRQMHQLKLAPNSETRINTESLAPGLYIINSGDQTQRLIITH